MKNDKLCKDIVKILRRDSRKSLTRISEELSVPVSTIFDNFHAHIIPNYRFTLTKRGN